MPGRGGKSGGGLRPKKKAFKPKQQKKRFIRSKDPILAVLTWGVQHSVSNNPTYVVAALFRTLIINPPIFCHNTTHLSCLANKVLSCTY